MFLPLAETWTRASAAESQTGKRFDYYTYYNKYAGFDNKRHLYTGLPIAKTDVLFIGDSMTDLYPLNEMFSTLHIKNRGISGSASADVLKSVRGFNIPNTVFNLVGINDFLYQVNRNNTIKNIVAIVNTLCCPSRITWPTGRCFQKYIPILVSPRR